MFMASLPTSSPAMRASFTTKYLDSTESLLGSEIKTFKTGVYLIFWNVRFNGMRVESLLMVNGSIVGRAISNGIKRDLDNGSNLHILRGLFGNY